MRTMSSRGGDDCLLSAVEHGNEGFCKAYVPKVSYGKDYCSKLSDMYRLPFLVLLPSKELRVLEIYW